MIVIGIFAYLVLLKILFVPLLPFLVAIFIYLLLRPVILFLTNIFHIRKNIAGFIMLLGIVSIFAFIMSYYFNRIYIPLDFNNLYSYIDISKIEGIYENNTWLYNLFLYFIESLSGLLSFLPAILFFVFILCLACFYLIYEQDSLKNTLVYFTETETYNKIRTLFLLCQNAITTYLKTQTIIMLITLMMLSLVFVAMDIKNALLYSFLLSLLDCLPFLGIGVGLIPLIVYYAYNHLFVRCLYIFIVLIFLTLLRSVIETQMMKHAIKIPSFLVLLSMVIHMYVYGICGVILSIVHMNIVFGYLEYRKK